MTAGLDNRSNQYGSGSLDQYNLLHVIAKIRLDIPAIPAIVGDTDSIRQAKNAITAPVMPPHKPDFQRRRTPKWA